MAISCDSTRLGRALSMTCWPSPTSVTTHVTSGNVTLSGGEPHQCHRGFSMA